MPANDDEAAERLWKYIEDICRANDQEVPDFGARPTTDPTAFAELLQVADDLHKTLQDAAPGTCGNDEYPAALAAAIQTSGQRALGNKRAVRRQVLLRWRPVAYGLVLVVAFTFLSWRLMRRTAVPTVTLRVQSMIRDHEEFIQDPARTSVKGDDPARVAAALTPQIGYPVAPVDLTLAGASLLGGRRCSLDGQVIAFFMYRVGKVPVSIYELRAPRCRLPGMAEKTLAGRRYLTGTDGAYNVLAWRVLDRVYVMVSALDTKRLIAMAQHLAGSASEDGVGETL